MHELIKNLSREELERLAFIDTLTQLPNLQFLNLTICQKIAELNLPHSLLLLDIDNMKLANSVWGYHKTDQILAKVFKAIRRSIKQSDFAAKVYGDECVILCQADENAASVIAERILSVIKTEGLTASIGIATTNERIEYSKLFGRANSALLIAKSIEGKGTFKFYIQESDTNATTRKLQ